MIASSRLDPASQEPPLAPIRTASALLVGCWIVGCAVGPDYQQPVLDPPDVWHEQLVAGLQSAPPSLEQWWTLLADPTLVSLVERATRDNLNLEAAVARVEAAHGLRGVAVGEWFPSADADALYDRGQVSREVSGPLGGNPSSLYSTGLSTSWEIDLFGRIRRSVEASEADLRAAVEDFRDVLVVLYADLATFYVEVRTLQERLRFARGNVESQLETLEIVQVRNRVGLVGDLDVRQAELNVARTSSVIPELEAALTAAINRVAVLIGEYPRALQAELAPALPIPAPPPAVAVGVPADLLRQRPDLRRAERLLAAQTARIGVATADLYPRLSLVGTFSFDATSTSALFTGDAQAWSFGPRLQWNLFDGGRIRSNIRTQEALTREAIAGYEQAVLLAVEDVENSLSGYARERERLRYLQASAEAADASVELVKVLYKTGLVDFQNVLDSERSLFEEQDRLARSQGLVTQNLIALYRALGGGWTP